MKSLIIPQNPHENYIPAVYFDAETGVLEISGESFMETPHEFYSPLIKWIEEYIKTVDKPLQFILKLGYYNTSSSKYILLLLRLLKNYQDGGGQVKVSWHYSIDDEDIADEIVEFKKESGLDIKGIKII